MLSTGGLPSILVLRISSRQILWLSSYVTVVAISAGLYLTMQITADVLLGIALGLSLLTPAGRSRAARVWRDPVVPLIIIPVALSLIWSADPADTALLTLRLLGLFTLVPLFHARARVSVPLLVTGMVLAAASQWMMPRPAGLSSNAVAAAELGLIMMMTGSPWLAGMAPILLGVTKTRSTILMAWLFAALSRRRSLLVIAAVASVVWFISALPSDGLERFTPAELSVGAAQRADNIGLADNGTAEYFGEVHGLESQDRGSSWLRQLTGTGAAAFNEATGLQRPHSVPVLVWQELRLFGIPVLLGLVLLLRRIPLAIAAPLSIMFLVSSDSGAGDVAGIYTLAVLALYLSGDPGPGRIPAFISHAHTGLRAWVPSRYRWGQG